MTQEYRIDQGVAVLDSITRASEAHRGLVLIAGSHGGDYCGYCAVALGLRGIILHDAGVGLCQAGIACLQRLEDVDVPAATVNYLSAHIGNGLDMATRGIISYCNRPAQALGVARGIPARLAAIMMMSAPDFHGTTPVRHESRQVLLADNGHGLKVIGLDSNSLVSQSDRGCIVVTGSHSALLGGLPASAIRFPVQAVSYNDAGYGSDEIGCSRLPALVARNIPAMAVRHTSARIGDARSSWETGIISRTNAVADRYGILECMPLQVAMARIKARQIL